MLLAFFGQASLLSSVKILRLYPILSSLSPSCIDPSSLTSLSLFRQSLFFQRHQFFFFLASYHFVICRTTSSAGFTAPIPLSDHDLHWSKSVSLPPQCYQTGFSLPWPQERTIQKFVIHHVQLQARIPVSIELSPTLALPPKLFYSR